jgi:hypothetical protein
MRFPHYEEPNREIKCCDRQSPSDGRLDFIVGEVKGDSGQPSLDFGDADTEVSIRFVRNAHHG